MGKPTNTKRLSSEAFDRRFCITEAQPAFHDAPPCWGTLPGWARRGCAHGEHGWAKRRPEGHDPRTLVWLARAHALRNVQEQEIFTT